jgi:prevent-host-death family protein
MKKVPIAEFKAHCSQFIDEIGEEQEIVITRHGKPVARLTPVSPERSPWHLYGILRGILPDPDNPPLSTGVKWDAES